MMGETGAGIIHEEDIDMERNNSLTQSWAVIKEKCPWFFKLKAIIDEHPSAVPVGVGNNSSSYDVSILAPSGDTSEFDWSDPGLGLDTTDGDGKLEGDDNGNDNSDGESNSEEGGGSNGKSSDDEGGNSDIKDVMTETQVPSKTSSLKTQAVMKRKATAVEVPETKAPKTSA
ncbi:hypothetical protein L208DRAFT_1530552 [Tricholoma matsutake]|nr:hypothetical protein L208DRAFT_1530552 [Tricholoma matsutake 945]